MNAEVFEKWFSSVLERIEEGSVIGMGNAPYHSHRVEKLPTSAWRKGEIQEWLIAKGIAFVETMLKVELHCSWRVYTRIGTRNTLLMRWLVLAV